MDAEEGKSEVQGRWRETEGRMGKETRWVECDGHRVEVVGGGAVGGHLVVKRGKRVG